MAYLVLDRLKTRVLFRSASVVVYAGKMDKKQTDATPLLSEKLPAEDVIDNVDAAVAYRLEGLEFRALDDLAKYRVSPGWSPWKAFLLLVSIGTNIATIVNNFAHLPTRDDTKDFNLSQRILFITEFAVLDLALIAVAVCFLRTLLSRTCCGHCIKVKLQRKCSYSQCLTVAPL